jgi:large subunit ribosomal protein L21
MNIAIIKTGGKQYIVSPGQKIKIEKLEQEADSEVIFNEVLLLEKDPSASSGQAQVEIGTPLIKGAKVIGKILKQDRAKKVIVFKYKPKKRYKVKRGHRQSFTEVEIVKI